MATTGQRGSGNITEGIEAVCFDLDGTLVDRDAAAREVYASWLRGTDGSLEEVMRRDGQGHGDRDAFFAWLGGVLGRDDLEGEFRRGLLAHLRPVPHAGEVVELLRGHGFPLALLTNGGSFQRAKLGAVGLAEAFGPGRVLVSAELGVSKPSPAAFAKAAGVLATEPGRVLYVGDHPVIDIEGASRAGMHTAWVRGSSDDTAARATFQVDSLADLATLVGCS